MTAISQPFSIGGYELRVSASIGVAIYPDNGEHTHDLMMNADAAMYQAKALGRNGYCFFEPSMNANAHEQLQLLHDLRSALERHELVLHYQPKFEALSGTLTGAEALLRWSHPTRGLIAPRPVYPPGRKDRVDNTYWRMGVGRSLPANG